MKTALIIALVVLFWMVFHLLLKDRTEPMMKKHTRYKAWIRTSLYNMFIRVNEKRVQPIMAALMIVFGAAGFLAPGKFTEIGQSASIEEAVELNKKGRHEEVPLLLKDLKKLKSPIVHNELGVAHFGLGHYDEAEKGFKRAIELLPHYGKAHMNLAGLYTHLGKSLDASFELSRARESSKYIIPRKELYALAGNLLDNLLIRLMLAAVLAYLGYRTPWLVIRFLQHRRMKKYEEQLPDGLIMAANGLRANLSLQQGFERVGAEARAPLNQEFKLVLDEYDIGADLDDALKHLAERMPTMDTKIFANSIILLRKSGGKIPEIFETIAHTIQERQRVQDKIKTITTEGKTQAIVLAILPIALGLIMDMMIPDVFSLMYTTFLGWLLIVLMALMEIAGLYWMMKIVKIKI